MVAPSPLVARKWIAVLMPRGYRQSKRDSNQRELVDYARAAGFSVVEVHAVAGALDLIVGLFGIDQRVEIKSPGPPSSQKLTTLEKIEFDTWKGRKPVIWTCLADVDALHDELRNA